MKTASELLGENGPFARALQRFRVRPGQQAMADAVAETIADRSVLVAEAGTGIGKTFAYLVPLIESGVRSVISTGTKTLQDQLFLRDLPAVADALDKQPRVALLKGRSNYLCHYRLERHGQDAARRGLAGITAFENLRRWADATRSGDLAEYPGASDAIEWRSQITSSPDNCLGQECPYFSDCFLVRARQRALKADIVVVNHHLLFADMALRREGFGELLPDAGAVVVDEAHRVPDTATQFFGQDLSSRMLRDLLADTRAEAGEVGGGLNAVLAATEELESCIKRFRLALEPLPARAVWDPELLPAQVEALGEALAGLASCLEPLAPASRGLEACLLRAQEHRQRLTELDSSDAGQVGWYESSSRGFALHLSPLDIAEDLQAHRQGGGAAWIFTSATLAAGNRFDLFCRRMGLDDARCEQFPSPFDFSSCALLYQPAGMPEPASPDYVDQLINRVCPVLDLCGGGAFLLFTSHRNLQRAAMRLRNIGRWTLFIQGEAPRHQLLEAFKTTPGALLLGAASFWEGVDVAGDALRCVVIDKLPFAVPDDPLLQARIRRIREQGGDPFRDEQLPHAVLTLKQGFGRLIRSESDHGVVVIGDPRLASRGYGRVFLASLPQVPLTGELAELRRFLTRHGGKQATAELP